MDRVSILKGYKYTSYMMYAVKAEGHVEFGGRKEFFCFDYASLAGQWGITKETLDAIAEYDLQFKDAMFVNRRETSGGMLKRTYLISADVVPALLHKLKESGQKPELNAVKELQIIKEMIKTVKEGQI